MGRYVNLTSRRQSMTAKLIQADEQTMEYYNSIKNYMLSYKNTRAEMAWYYESIKGNRKPVAKLGIRGKTLVAYFALDESDEGIERKYRLERVNGKKFVKTPLMIRIKSPRKLGYAKKCFDLVVAKYGLVFGKEQNIDYSLPYQSQEKLEEAGLIKCLSAYKPVDRVQEVEQEEAPAVEPVQENKISLKEEVQASEVDTLISNEEVVKFVYRKKEDKKGSGKKAIVNIDTLSRKFKAHDVVNLETLKSHKLVAANVSTVKLLARGSLNKPLEIEVDDFSLQAVKMVILTGGKITKIAKASAYFDDDE